MLKTQIVGFVLWLIAVAGLFAIWLWYDGRLGWQGYSLALLAILAVSVVGWLLKKTGVWSVPVEAYRSSRPGPIFWIAGAVVLAVWAAKILGWG